MTLIKFVRNFANWVTNFFYFDEISKMRILEPKNAFWKGPKKQEVKKSSNQKITLIKIDRNFTN